jgi:festuclavine dehydrogenase
MGSRLNNFIDVARSNGVRRFVLLSASNIEKGGPEMGKAHEFLAGLREIEYVVLRPTWFMRTSQSTL